MIERPLAVSNVKERSCEGGDHTGDKDETAIDHSDIAYRSVLPDSTHRYKNHFDQEERHPSDEHCAMKMD